MYLLLIVVFINYAIYVHVQSTLDEREVHRLKRKSLVVLLYIVEMQNVLLQSEKMKNLSPMNMQ